MALLDKYLRKLGLESYLELNDEERKTFKSWEAALAGRRLTDEDVATFLSNQVEDTLRKLPTMKLGKRDDTFLKMKLQFLRDVQTFLNSPKLEQKIAEASIARMVEQLPS